MAGAVCGGWIMKGQVHSEESIYLPLKAMRGIKREVTQSDGILDPSDNQMEDGWRPGEILAEGGSSSIISRYR